MAAEQSERTAAHARAHRTQSGAAWLDTHFAACRQEYEAMLRWAGLRPGWRMLDAGCGSGGYLPALAREVGPNGRITALDLQPENLRAVNARLADGGSGCQVATLVGSVAELPFADRSFDAVWCANTLQYFDDAALSRVLAEFRRVVRPGGLIAVKDVDMTLARIHPAPPFLLSHFAEASVRGPAVAAESWGSLRGRLLRGWLERTGLIDVRQQTFLIERWAPLAAVERALWGEWMALFAWLAEERGVPEDDLPVWRALADPAGTDNPINSADFYCCEGQVVAVGVVAG